MKKFIVSAFALLATVVCFNSCSGEDVEEKLTFTLELKSTEDGVQTFGGKDSDGDYLTMLVNEEAKTYELFWGESKKAENFEEFSTGTFTIEAGLSDGDEGSYSHKERKGRKESSRGDAEARRNWAQKGKKGTKGRKEEKRIVEGKREL